VAWAEAVERHASSTTDPEARLYRKSNNTAATLRYIGRQRNRAWFKINIAVYNILCITALDAQPA
jgi:hypothetical protein